MKRPITSSPSGTRSLVGVSHVAMPSPTSPPTATGSFTSALRKLTIVAGTSERPLLRPSSSARPLVCCCEKSGSPVTMKSLATHRSGAETTISTSSIAFPPGGLREEPQPVEAAQHPRLRAQQARERQQEQDRPAAPGSLGLQDAGPDHDREVRDVHVAACGEEREVEPRADDDRGEDADERGERRAPEAVEPDDEHHEAREREEDQHAVPPIPQERDQRAEDHGQRMLRRRAVGVERRQVTVQQFAAPEQRIGRVVVRVRRVHERPHDDDQDEGAEQQRRPIDGAHPRESGARDGVGTCRPIVRHTERASVRHHPRFTRAVTSRHRASYSGSHA